MDWSKGFSAMYYVSVIDAMTWREIERMELKSGSIKTTLSGLRQSADISCVRYNKGEQWLRVNLVARQGDSSEHVPLFTGISSCPQDDIDGFRVSNKVELYSVLKPCEDVLLQRGWYIPVGANGAEEIARLLSVTPAPVVVDGTSPSVKQNIISEDGESHLSMVEKILTAINWRMYIDGDGTIHVCGKSVEAVRAFDPINYDVIEPKLTKVYDWYSCPNVFRAVSGDEYAVARDDSPDSFLSTVNRGREIWMEDTSCSLGDGESLEDYAYRRLKEEQMVGTVVSYDRRYMPDIHPSDVVTLRYPAQGIEGDFIVTSQTITVGYGARTSEEVMKI